MAKVKPNLAFEVKENTQLLAFLLENCRGMSRNNIKALLGRGQVTVNGKRVKQFDAALKPGQRVDVLIGAPVRAKSPFPILFEDDELIVINKPAGLLSIATDKEKERTAYHTVTDYVRGENAKGRVFIVHRLDRETSGILLFAKSEKVKHALQDNWAELVSRRGYLAVVEGTPEPPDGTVRSWLRQTKTLLVYSSQTHGDGDEAITGYKTMQSNGDYTLVDVSLETGRKNQIRVHMKDIGNPVAGDKKYGAKTNPLRRLGLHANLLVVRHPFTGELLKFETAVPGVFLNVTSPR